MGTAAKEVAGGSGEAGVVGGGGGAGSGRGAMASQIFTLNLFSDDMDPLAADDAKVPTINLLACTRTWKDITRGFV